MRNIPIICIVLATVASLANAAECGPDECYCKCDADADADADQACDKHTGHCLICKIDICVEGRPEWPEKCKDDCPDYYNKHYGAKPSVDDPDGVNKWKITAIVVIPVMAVVIMVMAGVIVWLCKNRRARASDGRRIDPEEMRPRRDDPDAIPLVQGNGVGPTTQPREPATLRGVIAQTSFYGNDGEAATAPMQTRDDDRSYVAPQAPLDTSEDLSTGSIRNSDRHRNGSAARNRESPPATGGVGGHSAVRPPGTLNGALRPDQGGPASERLQPPQTRLNPSPNSNSSPGCFDILSQAPPRRGSAATEARANADSPSETSHRFGCESSGLSMPASSSSQTHLKALSPTDSLYHQEGHSTPARCFDDPIVTTASSEQRSTSGPVCHPHGEDDTNANPHPVFAFSSERVPPSAALPLMRNT